MNGFSTGPDWVSLFLIFDQIKGKLGKPGQKCMTVFEGMQSRRLMPGLEEKRDSEK